MKNKFFDKKGRPITLEEWVKQIETGDRSIGRTIIGPYLVSTVYLGLDMCFDGGEPLLFETMVFKDKSSDELDMERYSTGEEAIKGHEVMVKKYEKIWTESNNGKKPATI